MRKGHSAAQCHAHALTLSLSLSVLAQYFLIVFIVFVTMLVGGVLGYVFRENVRKHTDYKMRSTLADYSSKPNIRQAWDETQETVSME